MTVDTREEIQISYFAEDVESKEATAETDASVKGVKCNKKVKHEKDVSKAIIPVDDTKEILLIFKCVLHS